MLRRLVTWSYDRRRRVVALWVAALVAATVLAGAAGGDNETDVTVPGSDSATAVELLQERFPEFAGGTVDVVYTSDGGVTGPDVTQRVERLAVDLREVPNVVAAEPGRVAPDGSTGVLQVRFDAAAQEVPTPSVERVVDLAGEAEGDGLRVELGGYPIEQVERQEAGSESVGLLAALVILLVAFGSALAAGLPLVIAGFGLGVALGGVWLMANVIDVPDFGVQIATMIGIGVGIDYALFIVTRYRSALAERREPRDAVLVAGGTAGRAVVFAGSTVVVSIFGLVLMGRDYLWGVALATSLAVTVVVLASVTLLPALLGFAGRTIDRFRLPWFRHDVDGRRTMSWRWSRVVQRRPLLAGLAALVVLLVLAAPATDMRFGMPDAGNGSTDLTSRRAYDLVSEGFGPGANGPFLVAVDLAGAGGHTAATDSVDRLATELAATDGVAAVIPPVLNDRGDAAVISVVPATGPQDEATEDLVHALRDDVIPAAVAGTGIEASVGGTTAAFIDDSEQTASRLPLFIGGVVLLSFVLLMSVFRSLPVALKAAIMNLLSIGAAYGVMTLAGNGGWFGGLVGIDEPTPVPGWLPMTMFAVLFGLSMDYEVFLLSRVREEYVRTGDNRRAVADGLANTARVITAAAAIMVTVFGAFVMEDAVFLKLAGIGLATAVLVDATVVRMVLVPATMELLGDRNWWLPRWLDRLLPRLHVEGEAVGPAPAPLPDAPAAGPD
ncbi:MAG TPA: MMPL family transporter, partial [Acidimicrobiales bacterium]|nr:MMPL family transporter [Acidimicrobiales bacterium]